MRCRTCSKTAKYSVLLASSPHDNSSDDPSVRYYLPNQLAREEKHFQEVLFCHPCMRTIEDNLRATILYLQIENGLVALKEAGGPHQRSQPA